MRFVEQNKKKFDPRYFLNEAALDPLAPPEGTKEREYYDRGIKSGLSPEQARKMLAGAIRPEAAPTQEPSQHSGAELPAGELDTSIFKKDTSGAPKFLDRKSVV